MWEGTVIGLFVSEKISVFHFFIFPDNNSCIDNTFMYHPADITLKKENRIVRMEILTISQV
ncbi:MAG: hypothetical protein JXA44_12650 [Methanospirillaceae archaeon]|nr:hypothetical protein [Methanospirillaceae archaeon]